MLNEGLKGNTMLTMEDIALTLLRNGFYRQPLPGIKLERFEHKQLSNPLYLRQNKSDRDTTPLVLHPDYRNSRANLLNNDGIEQPENYYHNSNLTGYPKRLNRGKRAIEYGIELGFRDKDSLELLLAGIFRSSPYTEAKKFFVSDPTCGSGSMLAQVTKSLNEAETPSVSPLSAATKQAILYFSTKPTARDDVALTNTERTALIKARIGQRFYRAQLFSLWGGCAVTGCSHLAMLRASHAKPWSVSNSAERLDPHNGLLLIPNLDQAFDQGLISFNDNGSIILSPALKEESTKDLGITTDLTLRHTPQAFLPYLEWHRNNIFRK